MIKFVKRGFGLAFNLICRFFNVMFGSNR